MDKECTLLTFHAELVKQFMTVVVSCYSNAVVRLLDSKIAAVELTQAGTLFYQNSQTINANIGDFS